MLVIPAAVASFCEGSCSCCVESSNDASAFASGLIPDSDKRRASTGDPLLLLLLLSLLLLLLLLSCSQALPSRSLPSRCSMLESTGDDSASETTQ